MDMKMKGLCFVLPVLLAITGLCLAATSAKKPTPKAAARAEQLKSAIKSFKLEMRHSNVDEDKPYYTVTLTVEGIRCDRMNAFEPQAQITEEQAQKIIDCLATGGFLDRAEELKAGEKEKYPSSSVVVKKAQVGDQTVETSQTMVHYAMKVTAGKVIFYEDLGAGRPMLKRLDGLRKLLDGDAAKAMDLLLGRLAAYRKE
jgi:hypothetical protein